jgi:methionyl-tRNA synthetase
MSARYTSELANDFGNLASRLAAMVEKYCDGKLPAKSGDKGLESALSETVAKADTAMVALDFQGGINAVMDFCKKVNGYVTEKEPWILARIRQIKPNLKKFCTTQQNPYALSPFYFIP